MEEWTSGFKIFISYTGVTVVPIGMEYDVLKGTMIVLAPQIKKCVDTAPVSMHNVYSQIWYVLNHRT